MEQWKSDFFSCCESPMACCLTLADPCMGVAWIHCENKNLMDGEGGFVACCVDLLTQFLSPCLLCTAGYAWNRSKVREKYGLRGGFITDLFLYCCCSCCAAVQEYRECRVRATGPLVK